MKNKFVSEDREFEKNHYEHYSRQSMEEELKSWTRDRPIEQFQEWHQLAMEKKIAKCNSFVLATSDKEGLPNARVLLFKGIDRGRFLFFTHYQSQKSRELQQRPVAVMVFYWAELGRQVRIKGMVTKVERELSQQYFSSRPRSSQLAATLSPQGQVIEDDLDLIEKVRELDARTQGQEMECPDDWGGWGLTPDTLEFWLDGPNRLHTRFEYRLENQRWTRVRLAP